MTKEEMQEVLSKVLCRKDHPLHCDSCSHNPNKISSSQEDRFICRISEKTEQQLQYIFSSIKQNIFLEACAGSGKTEVVGMKMSYEISKWTDRNNGIAVLTFTNEATETIKNRVEQFSKLSSLHPHNIGTLTGFLHGFIAQKFGYKFFGNNGRNGDFSYRLIDKMMDTFKNHWLENYKSKIPYVYGAGKQESIYANQIYYDYQKKDYYIQFSENYKLTITEYYNSKNFQKFVQDTRNKYNNNELYKIEYVKKQLISDKVKFLKDGFANFEDMNNIAFKALQENIKVASIISKRFPIIIVDECQDLSWIEIQILKKLKDAGSTLHFIGDLNQAIYDFKNANPTYTKEFLSNFICYKLTDNFRSCQPIVDVSNRISSITTTIAGRTNNKLSDNSVCYYEYDDLQVLQEKYSSFLNLFNIQPESSSILVRQLSLKSNLQVRSAQKSIHLILDAIQLWKAKQQSTRIMALELAGKQLQKWLGGSKNKDNYFCPIDIKSAFRWRIFIKDFLEACCSNSFINNFENKKYGEWYKTAREQLPSILLNTYKSLKEYDENPRDFNSFPILRTPSGTTESAIDAISMFEPPTSIRINTIHSAKGCGFESVMVVSSKDQKSIGGHWKQWIEVEGESKRIGYVASTRAKYSLIWAVPKLNAKDRKQLETYGFKRIE
ncbi:MULTISPECIES: ATP-dependent helicase [Cohnella]|uniref:DNA 3'-5' helicase n=1 Tax=Cohnella fermenti TaxID=2565925 RepID=A0A4S4BRR9_9BACL|nr:ATP-dependent helicase [Cohnella fermenti]THF75379.1 ATP-dependent helicase [Cohnella fermenti]